MRLGGRAKKLDLATKVVTAQALYSEGTHAIDDLRSTLGVSWAMLYGVV